MRTEKVLWSCAILCAVFLLFGPLLGGRTIWVQSRGASIREGAGWDWLAALSGIVAIAGLVVGVVTRPRVVVPVLGAAAATVAFAATAYAAGSYWIALMNGTVLHEGLALDPSKRWEIYPPHGIPYFAVVATVATGFALVLAISWLEPADDEW